MPIGKMAAPGNAGASVDADQAPDGFRPAGQAQTLTLTAEASAEIIPGTPDSRRLAAIRQLCRTVLADADPPGAYHLADDILTILDAPEEQP